MMEGPRHQHLHQEWQEPFEEQGVAEDACPGTWRRNRLRGPGGARPPRHAITTAAAAVFVQLALRWRRNWAAQRHLPFWGHNWAAQWHLARAVGKRFRGCRAKRLCITFSASFCRTTPAHPRKKYEGP